MGESPGLTRRAVLAAAAALPLGASAAKDREDPGALVPPALKLGDRVALITPATKLDSAEDTVNSRQFVESLGFRPEFGLNATKEFGYLAGTDRQRVDDLNWALNDPGIRGIIFIKGGYGSMRYLPMIDYEAARRDPKVIVGYSDVTALLVALNRKSGIVTFHGPVATSAPSVFSTVWMKKALCFRQALGSYEQPDKGTASAGDFRLKTIHGGKAVGPLVGGNLTLLTSMLGTPYAPQISGKILFIEEVGEAPYRIDRMLTQLWLTGDLKKVKGVAVGQFVKCDEQAPDSGWKTSEVIEMRLRELGVPVLSGLAIGHIQDKITLPIGVRAKLDADEQTLTVLDPAVS